MRGHAPHGATERSIRFKLPCPRTPITGLRLKRSRMFACLKPFSLPAPISVTWRAEGGGCGVERGVWVGGGVGQEGG